MLHWLAFSDLMRRKHTFFPLKNCFFTRSDHGPCYGDPRRVTSHIAEKPDINTHFCLRTNEKPHFSRAGAPKKNTYFSRAECTGPDRRRYPPIFGDSAPTSSSRKKHSPPLVDQEEEGAEGAEGQGGRGLGLAGGSGGWLVAGRQGPGGSGGMVAWLHGGE